LIDQPTYQLIVQSIDQPTYVSSIDQLADQLIDQSIDKASLGKLSDDIVHRTWTWTWT
jgi:heat shock protein HspQ